MNGKGYTLIKILALSVLLTGCAWEPYYTGETDAVDMTQGWKLPTDAVIIFKNRTTAEVRSICLEWTGNLLAVACIAQKGGGVWHIYAPNKATALHEFKHFIYGGNHLGER